MSPMIKGNDFELFVYDRAQVSNINYHIQAKLHNLENFKTNLTKFENIRFKNFKILYIDWDKLQMLNHFSNNTRGFVINNNDNQNYKISYTVGYYDGFTFDGLEERPIFFTIKQCDIGYVFFDKELNYEKLNEKGNIYTVEYAVLVIVKSSSNIIVLQEVNYHKMNINIGLCLYINWVSKKGPLKFIPEDHIKDNGYFESSNGNAHIIIPFFKKSLDSNFFSCGKLKQPTLNDISIGYNLKYQNNENQYERKINPSHDNINCKNENDQEKYYFFAYSENYTNYMGERRMDKIDISYDKNYKIYAGQSIYIYPRGKIENFIKTSQPFVRLSGSWHVEDPSCVLELENNIKATILPTLGSLNFVKYNQHNKMFYQFIQKKDFDKKQELKCLSKVEGENKDHLDEFYSKAAKFTIINFNNKTNISKKISNEIIFDSFKMDNFGAYICKDSNYTKFYNKNIISLEKVYFIPENGTEIVSNDVKLEGNISQYAGCQRSYKPFSSTIKIKVDFIENNKSSTVIGKFPTLSEGIEIENNQVIYKDYGNITNITIQCEYETVFNTIFSTKQNFIFFNREFIRYKTKVVKDSNNSKTIVDTTSNSMLYIISFVLIVIFFCTVIVIIVVVMKRRKKRKLKAKKDINKSDLSLSDSLSSTSSSTSSSILSQSKNFLKKKGKKNSNEKITSTLSDLSTTTESGSLLSVSSSNDQKKGGKNFSKYNKFRITAK